MEFLIRPIHALIVFQFVYPETLQVILSALVCWPPFRIDCWL